MVETILQGDKITLGVCYYPEHWDSGLWKDDLLRMRRHGISVVRIGEFAWNKIEPVEGNFTFEFFDRFLALAAETGMGVIFGTPTAAPPAWLTTQYPEVLNAKKDGALFRHGARRHYNYNSPIYRRFTARIVEKIAAHYGGHPCVIGWQIDNELNCETDEFYSESDTAAFREFLRDKYGTLDALNEAWGTVFWNQTYTAWAEVYLPRPTIHDTVNPHQALDYIRFVSHSARSYAKLQSDIIRKHCKPGDFITTNGLFSSLDNHRMTTESLDFYTYDSYPNFAYCLSEDPEHSDDLNDRKWSRNLSEARSISPCFGIMEQQSGPHGWNTRMEAPSPKPGQMSLWAMQSIAHGAGYVGFFRWRTCTMGTEMYWHGLLDYSNRDNRRLAELAELYQKTRAIAAVAASRYQARFAVLKDYDNVWDAKIDRWHERVEQTSEAGIFQAAQLTHTPMDYVYLTESLRLEDLQHYPVLFYPHVVILSPERAALLEAYVEAGGVLVLGCRTGYKDLSGKCPMHKLPGLLQKLAGADVTDFTFVAPNDGRITVDWEGTELEAAVFNDILEPLGDAKALGAYTSSYYAGKPALIRNAWGKGAAYYFGSAFNRNAARVFLAKLGLAEPYAGIMEIPEECELVTRNGQNAAYYFILNYSKKPAVITLKKELQDLYTGKPTMGRVELPPYGTAVYKGDVS